MPRGSRTCMARTGAGAKGRGHHRPAPRQSGRRTGDAERAGGAGLCEPA
jgi:hypothetical protein